MKKIAETQRLILREYTQDDIDDLFSIMGDKDVMHFSSKGPLSKEDTQKILDKFIISYQESGYGGWAITWKETDEIIGSCGIMIREFKGRKENFLVYRLKKAFWGKKIGSEAAEAVLDIAFNTFRLDSVIAVIHKKNVSSIQIVEKIGMRFVKNVDYKGRILSCYLIDQQTYNILRSIKIIVASTEEEYKCCLAIRNEIFVIEQKISPEIEVDKYEKDSTHFLLLQDHIPIATARFRLKDNFLKFERLAVLKAKRGMKIGAYLMRYMQKIGFEKYPQYLQITHAQKNVINFYERLGWVALGDIFYEADIEHQLMINPPKNIDQIRNLLCFKDPSRLPITHYFLQDLIKKL